MANKASQFISDQLSVGSALQNILFYGMLVFLVCLVITQLQTKHAHARRQSISK
jgi:hypothetical protein